VAPVFWIELLSLSGKVPRFRLIELLLKVGDVLSHLVQLFLQSPVDLEQVVHFSLELFIILVYLIEFGQILQRFKQVFVCFYSRIHFAADGNKFLNLRLGLFQLLSR
jgi:hypothetical protein